MDSLAGVRNFTLWFLVLSSSSLSATEVMIDARGRRFPRPQNTPKIVSGFVGADEILVDLLKDEPEKILALSPLSNDSRYSAIYQTAQRWPSEFGAELETLIGKKPDLVIVARYTRTDWLKQLDQAGISSFVLGDFSSIDDIRQNIKILGFLTNRVRAAKKIDSQMMKTLNSLKQNCPISSKRVVNFSPDRTIYGKGTTFHSLVTFLGAVNAGADLGIQGWARLSHESQLNLKPDVIITSNDKSRDEFLRQISEDPIWKSFPATKHRRIIRVPTRFLSSVSHYITKAGDILCGRNP